MNAFSLNPDSWTFFSSTPIHEHFYSQPRFIMNYSLSFLKQLTVSTEKMATVDEADIPETMLSETSKWWLAVLKADHNDWDWTTIPRWTLIIESKWCMFIDQFDIDVIYFFRLCRFYFHVIEFVDFFIFDPIMLGTIELEGSRARGKNTMWENDIELNNEVKLGG